MNVTDKGTKYLCKPMVGVIGRPDCFPGEMFPFLWERIPDEDATRYLTGAARYSVAKLDAVPKIAGQLCYASWGPNATGWEDEDVVKYYQTINENGHGSVIEHLNFTLLLGGVSRSLTMELVRHRAGFSYSQLSQRYVGADQLIFVERPEFQNNGELHDAFIKHIDEVRDSYKSLQCKLDALEPEGKRRSAKVKAVNQAARAVLTNDVEAPIVVTANMRAWRHFFKMRGSVHAEPEIRILAAEVLTKLKPLAPSILHDASVDNTGAYPTIAWA